MQGYSLSHQDSNSSKIVDGTTENMKRVSRSGMMGMRPVVVSEEDSLLWTKVWGSATAVRKAKERRMRRLGMKAKVRTVSDGY